MNHRRCSEKLGNIYFPIELSKLGVSKDGNYLLVAASEEFEFCAATSCWLL